jgi:hypothetical protein
VDQDGGDIDAVNLPIVPSAIECGALCEKFPSCHAWTFHTNGGACFLKNKATHSNKAGNCISGTCKKT